MELNSGESGHLAPDYEAGPEALKILTVHAAKGLEFKYVFIVNLVDKRFPSIDRKEPIALSDELVKEILPEGDIHLEEERRLFYVAMTRAKEGLFFSWGRDYGGARRKKPSRFLIETGLVEEEEKEEEGEVLLSSSALSSSPAVKYPLPSHFSYSQIAAYERCPRQYYYQFILHVPVLGKAQFSFGRSMHKTMERIMERVVDASLSPQESLFSAPQKPSLSLGKIIKWPEIKEIYEASWQDDWFLSKEEKEEYFKKGKEILREFYNKHKDKILTPLYLEKNFKIKLAGGYTFVGSIDRVDKVEGGLKIIDYKTGQPKEKLGFADKEQLLIYQIAAQDLFGQPVKALSFYYLDENKEIEFLGTDKDLAKLEEKLSKVIAGIKSGDFPAKPNNLCAHCDFRDICPRK